VTATLEDRLWEKAEPVLYITKEEFLKSLEGSYIEPIEIDGELAFATLQKGPLFHFHSFGTKRQISLKMIRAFLQKIIDQYGYAETRTPKDDERQHRFNTILGFKQVGEDEFDTHFRIERLPHG
jgi:hypothetical protein